VRFTRSGQSKRYPKRAATAARRRACFRWGRWRKFLFCEFSVLVKLRDTLHRMRLRTVCYGSPKVSQGAVGVGFVETPTSLIRPGPKPESLRSLKTEIIFYAWDTPNARKVSVALEETEVPYVVKPVDITKGQQHAPAFLKISPNNRLPAIVDRDGPEGSPIHIFESGAILLYLGERTSHLLLGSNVILPKLGVSTRSSIGASATLSLSLGHCRWRTSPFSARSGGTGGMTSH
jgi:hypothetical protein